MNATVQPPTSFSVRALAAQVWRDRRRNSVVLVGSLVVGVLVALVLPVRYEGTVMLSPAPAASEKLGIGGALASLGGQLGIDVGNARSQLRFYPRLLKTYWFLSGLAQSPVTGDTTLYEVLTAKSLPTIEPDRTKELNGAVERLRRLIVVEVDDRANVFTVSIRVRSREAARSAVERTVALIADFDTRIRRLRASENRRFIAERADSARVELAATEDALATFQARNRAYAQSPDLLLQYQRLERAVAVKQEIYGNLSRSLEEARIEEVKEAPVVTIVDPPRAGWRKAEPRRRQVVALSLVAGIVCVLLLAALPMLDSA